MSELTTRLRLPRPTGGDPADVPADFDALTRRLDAVALGYEMGPLGSRPPTVPDGGRFYFATDIGTLYYDKGGAWVAVPTFGRGVQPAAGVAGRLWEESSTDAIYWDTGERWPTIVPPAGVRAQVFGTSQGPFASSTYSPHASDGDQRDVQRPPRAAAVRGRRQRAAQHRRGRRHSVRAQRHGDQQIAEVRVQRDRATRFVPYLGGLVSRPQSTAGDVPVPGLLGWCGLHRDPVLEN